MGPVRAFGDIQQAWTLKYFDKITAAEQKPRDEDTTPAGSFDFDDLGPDGLLSPITRRIWLWALRAILAFFRIFWPIPRFGRLVIVTRDADVREVLSNPATFTVPYGPEMEELGGGTVTFVLGLNGDQQRCQHKLIADLSHDGDTEWLIRRSGEIATTLIHASGGRIDVMKDLITRVAAETCAEFFGLWIDDTDAFAEWAMSISALLFADPFGKPAIRKLALAGAARVRSVIDDSVARLSAAPSQPPPSGLDSTILQRLVAAGISDDAVRAIMVGMITGFIPTTTLAAGNIVEELLTHPAKMRAAKAAAKSMGHAVEQDAGGAREKLTSVLFAAAQLNPALNPGQWRYAKDGGTIGHGLSERSIRKNSVLLVATASAMRDRPDKGYELVFGSGVHACLGKALAMAQVTEVLAVLLQQEKLTASNDRWGRIYRVGPFPRRLDMEFAPEGCSRSHSMVTILAPLAQNADQKAWRDRICSFGNPANPDIAEAFRATGVVHFASLNLIDLGESQVPAPHLLLELNGDGDADSLIDAVGQHASKWLQPLFESAADGNIAPRETSSKRSLVTMLKAHMLDLHARPWGTTGLCFYGIPGQSIDDIERQKLLARYCRSTVDYFVSLHAGFGSHAVDILKFVRGLIQGDPRWRNNTDPDIRKFLSEGGEFRRYLMIPSRQQPQTLAWQAPPSRTLAILGSPTLFPVYGWLSLAAILISVACFEWLGFSFAVDDLPMTLGQCAIALVAGCFGTVTLVGIVVTAFLLRLHYADIHDKPQDFEPDLAKLREIAKHESVPGFVQNHFLSVSPLKPGVFRKLTLGIALWGIELVVARAFRPGFIFNMGTIHFARWFRPPRSEHLVFLSNYDGSWESYLEDFITKAHAGQSAAWSNAVGFPRTQFLVGGGAEDGDRFKRWVRRQQEPTQFWFNRFPDLTADQIRNHAVICWELARASTDTQARAWLSYFGSMPKTDAELETQEVQSIIFRGFRHLEHMKFVEIRLPERTACAEWLRTLVPSLDTHTGANLTFAHGPFEITFGDRPSMGDGENTATFVAFTASGLSNLGLPGPKNSSAVATFPAVFNMGMASRHRILGDPDPEDIKPEDTDASWRWSDASTENGAHAILLLYGRSKEEVDALFRRHQDNLPSGARILYQLDTQPTKKGFGYEPFGFRDGISQPVIRGTQRFVRGVQPRDIMEPGEFLLGYKNNQGYYPPTPVIAREKDIRNRLGSVPISADTRFSAFQDPRPQVRDFGRNGSFLAIRQLRQRVKDFHDFAEERAEKLRETPRLADQLGGPVTREWVEAKMMGRWHDGVPLIDRPIAPSKKHDTSEPPAGEHHDEAEAREDRSGHHIHRNERRLRSDTDLDFGVDDPQGYYCPFGAHIRRANPRGSLAPDDSSQLEITNRHRLLRRGRPYEQENEQGLLFVGICADLERQFEFIQQSWLNAPGFAGLTNEPDPIASVKSEDRSTRFTIPTSAGSLSLAGSSNFVTARGGGYFFLPSRSALMFLADLNQPNATSHLATSDCSGAKDVP